MLVLKVTVACLLCASHALLPTRRAPRAPRAPRTALSGKKAPKGKRGARGGAAPRCAELAEGSARPKLVVFDLDNCLWTPELFELRKAPKAGKDVRLFDGARDALFDLATNPAWASASTAAAAASRASQAAWAEALLAEFDAAPGARAGVKAADVLAFREIYPGSKRGHFQRLKERSGVKFSQMLFFDDWTANLAEVCQLGVLCVHAPRGLTFDVWEGGLRAYARLKGDETAGADPFMGRVLMPHDLREAALLAEERRPV